MVTRDAVLTALVDAALSKQPEQVDALDIAFQSLPA